MDGGPVRRGCAGELALAQCVVYLAVAPKSNALYQAFNEAKAFITKDGTHGDQSLCVVSKDKTVPLLDQVLMQKLMIETKEKEFLELAGIRDGDLEREARVAELRLRYQQEMEAAQQHYADAMRALEQETQQAAGGADNFNFNFRSRFGNASPWITNGSINGLASS